jgi:acyl transferase domain-containing protein/acyl carrier protein
MDPQQRMLLECAWEAMEDAGLTLEKLSGSDAGVFVGISTHDYSDMHAKDVYTGNSYTNSGGAQSIAANRISYVFDLRGPSFAVDTACSSSLVAVHLACNAIWNNECSVAIAGGVNCMLTPEPTIGFSKANMLSPDGQCHTFDASANGYVRGEGAGAILLKPLSQAIADGDEVYAVIRGTGINQDGRTHGMTVPSQEQQEALLRQVYSQAGIAPEQVIYVEAHGTGTPVGDPIEANAIGNVLGAPRRDGTNLRVGSVKTNIGHLEAASGMAGLIKAAMSIKHRRFAPNRNFSEPNPKIPFDRLKLDVQVRAEDWPAEASASVIGINSFGFGGSNAHVAVDVVPESVAPQQPSRERKQVLLPISARSPEALKELATAYRDLAAAPDAETATPLAALAHAAGTRRSHLENRLALTAGSHEQVVEHLDAFLAGDPSAGMASGRAASHANKVAFVYSGMGPQWQGMGQQLLDEEPVFRAAVEEADLLFQKYAGWSILEALCADAACSRMDQTEVAQPANFVLQVGLTALWRSWGIVPDAIIGHSAGEIGSAWAAGVLSLEDAVRVIYHRSRLQQLTSGEGGMLAVGLSAEDAMASLNGHHERVSLAAINSQRSVTLSGDVEAIEDIARKLDAERIFARVMDVNVPYHSHYMDRLRAELLETLGPIEPQEATIPFYSTVYGGPIDGPEVDATYWWRNVREPVRFWQALDAMLEEGITDFVEVGPHPVLSRSVIEVQNSKGVKGAVLPTLRKDAGEAATMLSTLGTLYTMALPVDWSAVNPASDRRIELPLYPWQRERHWNEAAFSVNFRTGKLVHPLLERRMESARLGWETHLNSHDLEYLNDHVVQKAVVFPGAAYLEMALAAAREMEPGAQTVLTDVEFKRPLALASLFHERPTLQLITAEDNSFTISSQLWNTFNQWNHHANGFINFEKPSAKPSGRVLLKRLQSRGKREVPGDAVQAALAEHGLTYGPHFRGINRIWQANKEALGEIVLTDEVTAQLPGYRLHPAALDACFQVLSGASSIEAQGQAQRHTYIPVKLDRLRFVKPIAARRFFAHARLTTRTESSIVGEFTLYSEDGDVLAEVEGFRCQLIPNARKGEASLEDLLYEYAWFPRSLPVQATGRDAAFLASPAAIAASISIDATASPDVERELQAIVDACVAASPEAAAVAAAFVEAHPEYEALVAEIERAATQPAAGDEPEDEGAEPATVDNSLLQASPYAAPYSQAIGQAVRAAIDALPAGRTVRVLELGAANGGRTAEALAALPQGRTEYVIGGTSLPSLQIRQRFAGQPNVEFVSYDVTSGESSLPEHSFDLVIATDIFCGVEDVAAALGNVSKLLASEGVLLAIEPTCISGAVQFAMSNVTARAVAAWRDVLAEAGFDSIEAIESDNDGPSQAVLIARAGALAEDDEPVATPRSNERWLVFADNSGLGAELAEQMGRGAAAPSVVVTLGSGFKQIDDVTFEARAGSQDDLDAVLEAITATQAPLTGVAYLWGLETPTAAESARRELPATASTGGIDVLHIVQGLARLGGAAAPRLWVVTRGAQAVRDENVTGALQAPLWGLGRVIMNEFPHLRCTLVDLDPAGTNGLHSLVEEIQSDDAEQEIALRADARYIARVVGLKQAAAESTPIRQAGGATPFVLDVETSGSLDGLVLREQRRKRPASDEVEIEVYAAGLNFRDVMKAMGLYPQEEGAPFWLGDECSGVISRVGRNVKDFKPGDEVLTIAAGAFSSFVNVKAANIVRKPKHLSFEEAATVPIVFLTTHYALNHIGRLAKGEKVLIHAAAGGVGMAAIQLAKLAGAEIFGTAGNPDKRQLVLDLGAQHVHDSRSLDFAAEIMSITRGKGIDMVLNSLAGEFIPKSMSLLKPMGRFLEIGKVDLYQNSKLGLYPFRSGLSFSAIDMGWLTENRPELAQQVLAEVMQMFEERKLQPLPVQAFPVAEVSKAFRYMAQARHVGKIVISMRDPQASVVRQAPAKKALFRKDGTYLVTGGFSGFGLATAQWMAKNGAKNLVLASRSGAATDDAKRAVAELQAAGVRVEIAKVDVSDRTQVNGLVSRINATMPPLRGVFHAAMVIDDGYLLQLTQERFDTVYGPKLEGAWNLHLATRDQPLDYFVMFSSVSALVGSVGQGNYAAANAFLDALAQHRRSAGQAALSVNWGVIADVGYAARNQDVTRLLDRQGVIGIRPAEATEMLGILLRRGDVAQAGAMRFDFDKLRESIGRGAAFQRFSTVLLSVQNAGASSSERRGGALERLAGETPEVQLKEIEALLKREVANVLGIAANKIDIDAELLSLGLDSLMSVELEMTLERELGAELPLGFFLVEDLTLKGLALKMRELIQSGPGEGASDDGEGLDEALTENAGEPDLVAAS